MRGSFSKTVAAGLASGGLLACSSPSLNELAALPVRTTPQDQVPYSEVQPGSPLRGTAVAVDVAVSQ